MDCYGGQSLADRTRFAVELIRAVRERVGEHFPICLRFSQWKLGDYDAKLARDPEELASFLLPLSEAGVDLFQCSTRRFFEPDFPGSSLNLAGWTKQITGKPTITVGSIGLDLDFVSTLMGGEVGHYTLGSVARLVERLEGGEFDLAAVGRGLLADPEWLTKIVTGRLEAICPFSRELLATID